MHFAAFASVPESVADPAKYYRNNVVGTLNLLDAMRAAGVGRIVFSSTAAVYGVAGERADRRGHARQPPINPYGFTKLAIERALADYAARLRPRLRRPPLLQRLRRLRRRARSARTTRPRPT